ncbi:unnamed protein product [Paramecium primaurelia]|uniref:Uncharacterized protein n=1 Tax=Paramecium primaurelia TaxID=5886 RepID=A0A8S1M2I5_PARPR|nr:unnamed protein product [Paramecium primaurelia]
MKAANLNHKLMTKDEVIKILQLKAEKDNAERKIKVLIVTEDQDLLEKVTKERFIKLRINKYSINNAQCQK